MPYRSDLVRVEISRKALLHNIAGLRAAIGTKACLAAVIKANAYGHGLLEVADVITEHVNWLLVHCIDELHLLRQAGHQLPILVLSYVQRADLAWALSLQADLTVCDILTARDIATAAARAGCRARVHLKVETGTHRQGVMPDQLAKLARFIDQSPDLQLNGVYTHFANIEDTTDHSYAFDQLKRYHQAVQVLAGELGITIPHHHTTCSAAALLFPQTHLDLVRTGIAIYGLWPSRETLVSARSSNEPVTLEPVMSVITRVSQIKEIPAGAYVGYGCTFRATRPTRLAILPAGYFDGYDRLNSNAAHVLIRGQRAPVRGRVSMNLTVVDVTDIPGVALEDEAVLLGHQGEEHITAEQLAAWCDTINYEVVTRFAPFAPRIVT